ncbi:MAG: hypothetical protein M3Y17_05635 [Actinomycetota bacterium]|nr:hypothetical protein [Actinomycetota bacterium]
MSAGRYALGVAALVLVCGSLGLAAVTLRRRFFPGWSGAPARLVESVIALALLVGLLELLGTVGLFSLGPIVAASVVVGLVVGLVVRLGVARALGEPGEGGRRGAFPEAVVIPGTGFAKRLAGAISIPFLIALVLSAAVAAEWAGPTLQSYDTGIHSFDSLWYHLPWAASFAQTGQITSLRFTDVEYLTAFYPATAELFHGLGIVLLARDTISGALNLAWLGLTLLAAYCIGRPRGLGPWSLAGAALALATPMMSFSQAGSGANDVVGVCFLLAAVALLVNVHGGERRAPFVLAALAAGLAVSVKLSLLAPVLALSIGMIVLARPWWARAPGAHASGDGESGPRAPGARAPARLTRAALWLGPLLLGGGFWYLRNLVAVGNPLPWTSLGFLPTPAPALQQHTAFSVAHYLGDSQVLSKVLEPGLAAGLGRWWAVILAAAVIGPLLCLLPGADRLMRVVSLVALGSLAAYLLTPESAAGPAGHPLGFAFNLRYAAPALTLSLAILPLAPVLEQRRRRAATMIALVAVLVATLAQAQLWPSRHLPGALGAGAAVLVLSLAILAMAQIGRGSVGGVRRAPYGGVGGAVGGAQPARAGGGRGGRSGPSPRRLTVLSSLAALLIALAAAGYPWQQHYLRGRYAFHPGVSSLAKAWALFRGVHDARVGLVGTFGGFFSYPLFGIADSNHVQYIAKRGPHGSFTALTTCQQWRTAVNAGHYRFLLTTPARDPWRPKALQASPEGAWTASDPDARLLYTRRAAGQRISVYELRGRLDPGACG